MKVYQPIKKLVKDKRVLFLENDNQLSLQIKEFYKHAVASGAECNCLYSLRELPLSYILSQIIGFDIVVFQTTWTYEESHKLLQEVLKLERVITFVECFILEPTFYTKPSTHHHYWNFNCLVSDYTAATYHQLKFINK